MGRVEGRRRHNTAATYLSVGCCAFLAVAAPLTTIVAGSLGVGVACLCVRVWLAWVGE